MRPTSLFFILLLLLPTLAFAEMQDCQPIKIDKWVKMDYATAGNKMVAKSVTYQLNGLYAPLRAQKSKFFQQQGQPLAKTAQKTLNQILADHDQMVGIEYDKVKVDKFLRIKFHGYVKEGKRLISIEKLMIEQGLGLFLPEAENSRHAKCYLQAEADARKNVVGLWAVEKKYPQLHFPLVQSAQLTLDDIGFRIIQGPIKQVWKTGNNYIINMDTTGIRVKKEDWHRFDYQKVKALQGQTAEVRGYGFIYNNAMYVVIQSPNAINLLDALHNQP